MDYKQKCRILVEFAISNANEEIYEDFFAFHDLGIPVALAVKLDAAILTKEGLKTIDETWTEFCALLNIDASGNYESLKSALESNN